MSNMEPKHDDIIVPKERNIKEFIDKVDKVPPVNKDLKFFTRNFQPYKWFASEELFKQVDPINSSNSKFVIDQEALKYGDIKLKIERIVQK